MAKWFDRADAALVGFMQRRGIPLLQLALAVVFIWFGALKLAGHSPVAGLVGRMAYGLPPQTFLLVLGVWEVTVGALLLLGVALRLALLLFWLLLAGTLLLPVLHPEVAFQRGNPLLLTTEGEFVVKNLVLIAAGLVVGSTVRRTDK